jgi:hypothetical protein
VSRPYEPLGYLSALGTFVLILLIAWLTGAFPLVFSDLSLFVGGNYDQIAANHTTFLMMFPVMLAVVALALPCAFIAIFLQAVVHGQSGRHALRDMLDNMGTGNHFFTFFVNVFIEELLARWLFLGLLTQIPVLSGPVAFYVLFFLGNLIWALVHLGNYTDDKDKRVLRVLPQFVGGIFFTYVFVKYGLLATILTHFAYNAVLFAIHKLQRFTVADALILVYAAICAGVSFAMMDKPLADILQWFSENPNFVLPGWEFKDYLTFSVFFGSIPMLLFGLLLYDQRESEESDSSTGLLDYLLGVPLAVGMLYGMFYLLGFIISDVPLRILVLAILFTFLTKSASGSAMSRSFWVSLPDLYITVCIIQALGFWPSVWWLALSSLIMLPVTIFRRLET